MTFEIVRVYDVGRVFEEIDVPVSRITQFVMASFVFD